MESCNRMSERLPILLREKERFTLCQRLETKSCRTSEGSAGRSEPLCAGRSMGNHEYRDKKAIPLINKLVKILYSLHHKYWKVKNECAKFMERYADEREANQNLRQRIEMLQEENTRLKAVEHNFGRVWSYYGAEQVKRVVELMAGRERAAQNVQRQKREHENVI